MKYQRYKPVPFEKNTFNELIKRMDTHAKRIKLEDNECFFICGMLNNAKSDVLLSPSADILPPMN